MSLLNGISGLGTSLSAFAGSAATDEATKATSLLNNTPPPADPAAVQAAPADAGAAASLPGPRMPPGVNPYGDNPHAQALWLAEQSIKGPESGGKADAQNPVSSAGGLFQITDSTWDRALQTMGLPTASDQANRNAQKYNPDLNTSVFRQINTEAASALDAAGLPVDAQTLSAAHRLGPSGATTAIKAAMADPSAPLVGNGLSPDAVKGNGDISHMTVGQFLAAPYPNARTQGGS
jgi:hypothetical protein